MPEGPKKNLKGGYMIESGGRSTYLSYFFKMIGWNQKYTSL